MKGGGRIIFDVSSITRWIGPAVGIVRVENALAAFALANRPDILLSVYDARIKSFRALDREWAARLTGWDASLEILDFEYRRDPKRLRNWVPSRYSMFMALERLRLTVPQPAVRGVAEFLQQGIMLARHLPPPFADPTGQRLAVVPATLALHEPIALGPGDILVTAGYDWYQMDMNAIAALKRQCGFRYIAMCYDIIPLISPEFFQAADVENFRSHWLVMFGLADRIIVNSRRVMEDIAGYCADMNGNVPDMRIVPLGYDPPPPAPRTPEGLEAGRYILFVSTIEPRKGHGMLLSVWRRLLAASIPQRHRFKLVFVGRRGWLVDDVMRELDHGDELFGDTVLHLTNVADDELRGLYRACAFCVYPSQYEGFGLPIVEAFSHGKAVLTSTGGALPETVNGFSPCLDPSDEAGWYREIARFIEDPAARASYERLIRASFNHPDWDQAAAQFFAAAVS